MEDYYRYYQNGVGCWDIVDPQDELQYEATSEDEAIRETAEMNIRHHMRVVDENYQILLKLEPDAYGEKFGQRTISEIID